MIMLIVIILFLILKTQNYMSMQSLCQQKTMKYCQNFLAKDFQVQYKTQQKNIDIFWD